ncbi:hypothetical protein CLCR_03154 [Cladophialophora carrionii]|uniref:Uncharacterized protein n=1 Tax=Cladophialophora carrionii TaxID=86049 RepID=A0A1C1D2H6_9EURO|nr:hypothetical protein CLCR_03154 [Cladophialophora carrionii]
MGKDLPSENDLPLLIEDDSSALKAPDPIAASTADVADETMLSAYEASFRPPSVVASQILAGAGAAINGLFITRPLILTPECRHSGSADLAKDIMPSTYGDSFRARSVTASEILAGAGAAFSGIFITRPLRLTPECRDPSKVIGQRFMR